LNALRSTALTAVVAALLGLAAHPHLEALRSGPTGRAVIATLALLLASALLVRALRGGPASRLLAAGVVLSVAGLGFDAVGGHQGRLRLQTGQASQNFVEEGPGGGSLGLRPLGFQAALEGVRGDGALLALGGQQFLVTPSQAAGFRGVRFGRPRFAFTGEALALRLERYFPDFALDAQNQPFSRSDAPGQTAALLDVRRGPQSFRVFVLSSAPGVHQVEGLGVSFALQGVEPARELDLRVSRAPAAGFVLAGVVLAGLGLGLSALQAVAPRRPEAPVVATGALLSAALVALGGGGVLRWTWLADQDAGGLLIPAAGLPLGLALLAGLGGTLLVAVPLLASREAAPARPLVLGRRGLILGATLACLGVGVLLVEAGLRFGTAHEAALLALLAGAVGASVASPDAGAMPRAAAAGSLLLLAVVGVASWLQAGGYDSQGVASLACVSLLALAASE
jgi:hypothetical protein